MTEKAENKPVGLALLRAPFAANHISKLPKPTKAQTDAVRDDYKSGVRCQECGGWHHPKVVHLDYVGHAALTDRLLDCDAHWNWEPFALNERGLPALDENGGLWINLTVCGVTRPGYGSTDGKKGGDAIKELIGDALRNAAMRFGAALDLWHKGDLHGDEGEAVETQIPQQTNSRQAKRQTPFDDIKPLTQTDIDLINLITACNTVDDLTEWSGTNGPQAGLSDNAATIRAAYKKRLDEINKPKTKGN